MNPFCDLYRYVPRGGESTGLEKGVRFCLTMLLHPGWHAVFNFRLSQLFYGLKLQPVGWFIYRWNMFVFSVDIHPSVKIGPGLWVPHPIGIVVARDAVLGRACTVFQNVTIGGRGNPPVVGDGVMVGAGACVIGPARIGNGVRIGANAVVVNAVPDNVTVGGVPASIIGHKQV